VSLLVLGIDGMDIGMLGSRKSHEGGEKLLEVDGGVSGRVMRKG